MKNTIFAHPLELSLFTKDGVDFDKEFELVNTVETHTPNHGKIKFSKEDLEEMVFNFDNNALGQEIPVGREHLRLSSDEVAMKGADGWIKEGSLSVKPSPNVDGEFSLFGKIKDLTKEVKELLGEKKFKYISIEVANKAKSNINGAMKVVNNLIFGVTLTVSPAIRDLTPLFSRNFKSLDDFSLSLNNMKLFNIYLSALSAKEIVTKEEKETLTEMFSALSEDEQGEQKEGVDAVQEKPEEAEKDAEEDNEEEEKELSAKNIKSDEEEKELSAKYESASEENKNLSARLETLEKTNTQMKLSQSFDSELLLSEKTGKGFKVEAKDDVVSFMLSLSEEQREQATKLFSKVVAVNTKEYGYTSKEEMNLSELDIQKKIDTYSKELQEKGVGVSESIAQSVEKFTK